MEEGSASKHIRRQDERLYLWAYMYTYIRSVAITKILLLKIIEKERKRSRGREPLPKFPIGIFPRLRIGTKPIGHNWIQLDSVGFSWTFSPN